MKTATQGSSTFTITRDGTLTTSKIGTTNQREKTCTAESSVPRAARPAPKKASAMACAGSPGRTASIIA